MGNKRIQICIGRQFGAGGRIISKMLTERFGCQYFDKEILKVAAEESGFSPSFFKENDEKKSFFHTLFHNHAPMLSDTRVCLSSSAMPSARRPRRATACLSGAVPTMCSATIPTW